MLNSTILNNTPRILYIDMAYTINMIQERGLDQELVARECGGYFDHVWGVHPIADIPENKPLKYDGFRVNTMEFSPSQTLIEGSSEYYSLFKKIFPLNFLISQIRFVTYLVKLIKRERIDIVMTTDPHFSGLMGLLLKWFTKAKFAIWVVANNDDIYKATGVSAMPRLFKKRWVEKIVERITFNIADLVAGGNQNNLEFALGNGAKISKSTVFPVGKLIHRQHQVEKHLRQKDEFFESSKANYHFIYVGRLVNIKHPDDVIRAFAEINGVIPNCALIMAGDGPMIEELEAIAEKLGVKQQVTFLGNISQTRLAKVFAGCFTVLSPLTGRSLIESALAGLPIVAYDRDWQAEFVGKHGAGVIVPYRDWEEMGRAALKIVQDPEAAKQMADASRRAGMEACDIEKMYAHEKREFEKLLRS